MRPALYPGSTSGAAPAVPGMLAGQPHMMPMMGMPTTTGGASMASFPQPGQAHMNFQQFQQQMAAFGMMPTFPGGGYMPNYEGAGGPNGSMMSANPRMVMRPDLGVGVLKPPPSASAYRYGKNRGGPVITQLANSNAAPASGSGKTAGLTTVYVGHIAPAVPEETVKQLLHECGKVARWTRTQDPATRKPSAFGFCEFETSLGVWRATRSLNGLELDGQKLVVNCQEKVKGSMELWQMERMHRMQEENPAKTVQALQEDMEREDSLAHQAIIKIAAECNNKSMKSSQQPTISLVTTSGEVEHLVATDSGLVPAGRRSGTRSPSEADSVDDSYRRRHRSPMSPNGTSTTNHTTAGTSTNRGGVRDGKGEVGERDSTITGSPSSASGGGGGRRSSVGREQQMSDDKIHSSHKNDNSSNSNKPALLDGMVFVDSNKLSYREAQRLAAWNVKVRDTHAEIAKRERVWRKKEDVYFQERERRKEREESVRRTPAVLSSSQRRKLVEYDLRDLEYFLEVDGYVWERSSSSSSKRRYEVRREAREAERLADAADRDLEIKEAEEKEEAAMAAVEDGSRTKRRRTSNGDVNTGALQSVGDISTSYSYGSSSTDGTAVTTMATSDGIALSRLAEVGGDEGCISSRQGEKYGDQVREGVGSMEKEKNSAVGLTASRRGENVGLNRSDADNEDEAGRSGGDIPHASKVGSLSRNKDGLLNDGDSIMKDNSLLSGLIEGGGNKKGLLTQTGDLEGSSRRGGDVQSSLETVDGGGGNGLDGSSKKPFTFSRLKFSLGSTSSSSNNTTTDAAATSSSAFDTNEVKIKLGMASNKVDNVSKKGLGGFGGLVMKQQTSSSSKSVVGVFGSLDDDDDEDLFGNRKRGLTKLDAPLDKANQQQQKDKLQQQRDSLAKLASKIPKENDKLFAFLLDWDILASNKVLTVKLKPWVTKKVVEYLGQDVPDLTTFIIDKINTHPTAEAFSAEVTPFLEQDTEGFVVKLWKMLVFEQLRLTQ